MHTNYSAVKHQQQQISDHHSKLDALGFFNQLTSDQLFERVESLLPDHRERTFPPTETLSLFLSQAISVDRSCRNVVNQSSIARLIGGLPKCSTATGGYCKARSRLPVDMVRDLTRFTGQLIDQKVCHKWRWQGRRVRIVDGTTVTLPDTPKNQKRYPQLKAQKPGLGFPMCRLVGITCLSSGALLDSAMCPVSGKGNDEQSLLRTMIKTFENSDILLGDAFYATYFLIAELQEMGVDAVFEQHGSRKRSTDFRLGKKLGSKDHLIVIKRPRSAPAWMSQETFDSMPETLTVRELNVKGKVLITTLCCPVTATKEDLKNLYKSRWNIELDIRHIKTTMGMDVLSCLSPDMAEKEVWVYLLAYNLIRLIMIESALLCDVIPRQLSFKHASQLWLTFHQQTGAANIELIKELLLLVGQLRVGNRTRRVEPRVIKRRPKAYSMMVKSRSILRQEIIQNWT
jgi:hypothetical protein